MPPVPRPASESFRVALLDVGEEKYGDAVACQLGEVRVLIDGAHRSNLRGDGRHPPLVDQLRDFFGLKPRDAVRIDLLVVTHCHDDHIGCLPELVVQGVLAADWTLASDPERGWPGGTDVVDDEPARRLLLALREEPLGPGTSTDDIERLFADAANLRDRYEGMLQTLARSGKVIRFDGRPAPLAPLLASLKAKGVDLAVLGPTARMLERCTEKLRERMQDLLGDVQDALAGDTDLAAAYQAMSSPSQADAQDSGRAGNLINLQSIVTSFAYQGQHLLFTGDMQLADAESRDEVLELGRSELLGAIKSYVQTRGKLAFAKLAHHGSPNGTDEEVLSSMGLPALVGLCAGEESKSHPAPETLQLLRRHQDALELVRTDRHGMVIIDLSSSLGRPSRGTSLVPVVRTTREKNLHDWRPPPGAMRDNVPRAGVAPAPPAPQLGPAPFAPLPPPSVESVNVRPTPSGDAVVVTAYLPQSALPLSLTVRVERNAAAAIPEERPAVPDQEIQKAVKPALRLFGGRMVPKLLFATSGEALRKNIGRGEGKVVLDALGASSSVYLLDDLPARLTADEGSELVRGTLQAHQDIAGVVLLGGYDVLPAHRMDCLPPEVRQGLSSRSVRSDADRFIVWSDDAYGDRDGDRWPDVPVSRIPDGRTAALVFTALQAVRDGRPRERCGIRNAARQFADEIFSLLPGATPLLTSGPTVFDATPSPQLDAEMVYLMLHGSPDDGTHFWGESQECIAAHLSNVPRQAGAVVLTGCCWGALTVEQPAFRMIAGEAPAPRTPDASLALTFLEHGALAFVGCTGSHYSPMTPPYDFFGGPMHREFWQQLKSAPPAQALFLAKEAYRRALPHGQEGVGEAIEYKILRQFTCLGLGW